MSAVIRTPVVIAGRPAQVVQAPHWLREVLRFNEADVLKRLRVILDDPIYGPAIRDDLRHRVHMLPTWMQAVVRRVVTARTADHSVEDRTREDHETITS